MSKRIIIAGATSGLGLKAARVYAAEGWTVGAAGRNMAVLEGLAAEYPGRVITAAIDIDLPEAGERLRELIGRTGGMDVYLHVAGIGYDNPESDPGRDCAIAATDCVGFVRMVRSAFNYFSESGTSGQIAAVSSVAGTRGIGPMAAYSASKRFDSTYLEALRQLARARRMRLAITDIRPGWTRTPLLERGSAYPMEMDADRVVSAMVSAIGRRRRVATIDGRWRILCALWRLLPSRVWTAIDPDKLRFTGRRKSEILPE